jgi:predicted transcriptional regulator YdeE
MNLTEEPDIVTFPATHYVFVEKTGPFMQTAPAAWGELHSNVPAILENNQIANFLSLYKMSPKLYRAGVSLDAPPVQLPEGLLYELFAGGRYSRFTLTGPYTQLPAAAGRVWEIVSKTNLMVRPDFAIENYVNNPRTTPEDKLITEILIPTE